MKNDYKPKYISAIENNSFQKTLHILLNMLENCTLCPHKCKVNRKNNELGFCKTGYQAKISSAFLHFGEEPQISGIRGSGTIFFSNCNMKCIYCQNFEISHLGEGYEITEKELAETMLQLQKDGAHNINFVSPTHIIPQILSALYIAANNGLRIPIIYNSGGYDSPEIIKLLENIFDIYMPDIKYSDNALAYLYSGVKNYKENCYKSIIQMHKNSGTLKIGKNRVAQTGLLIRHLILPNQMENSKGIIDFIVQHLPKDTYINIMPQYHPIWNVSDIKELSRKITLDEFNLIISYAKLKGLKNII